MTPTQIKKAQRAMARALELLDGNVSRLARACDVRRQAVQQWIAKGYVPAEQVLSVEAAVEGRVTRFDLRPDLHPTEMPWVTYPESCRRPAA